MNIYMGGVLSKREVKIVGYWPSTFFAFLWIETKSRSIKTPKRTRPIFSYLDRTSLYGQMVTPSISFYAPANVSARDFQNHSFACVTLTGACNYHYK